MQFHIMLAGGCLILMITALQYYILQHFRNRIRIHGKELKKSTLWILSAVLTAGMLLCLAAGGALPHIPWLQSLMGLLGAVLMGTMSTCLLLFPIVDIITMILRLPVFQKAAAVWKKICMGGLTVAIAAVMVTAYGIWNSARITLTEYTVPINGLTGEPIQLVLLSDMHEGSALRTDHLQQLVEKTNALSPDCIILCGDLFDENTADTERDQAYKTLAKLKAPMGVFFVFGNHERNLKQDGSMRAALEAVGITVIEDDITTLDDRLQIIGRKDITEQRIPLAELTAKTDPELPILLLDHQPKDTQKAAELGIDLQVSGHTHGGQVFPGGWISDLVNEATYGLHIHGDYHLIVSSGCSIWGVPFRTAKTTEIVSITLHGN